jgi:hypothetical protein
VDGSIKLAKPKEYLAPAHPLNTAKVSGYLRAKKTQFEKDDAFPKLGFVFSTTKKRSLLEASYKVAYLISKQKKLHIISDTLWKPCSLEMGLIGLWI